MSGWHCEFCGASTSAAEIMIVGNGRTAICDKCVLECAETIAAHRLRPSVPATITWPRDSEGREVEP